jgi:hypothetical protein
MLCPIPLWAGVLLDLLEQHGGAALVSEADTVLCSNSIRSIESFHQISVQRTDSHSIFFLVINF